MNWLKASIFLQLDDEDRETALSSGIYPVNDVLVPFMSDGNKIQLLYGGRGGGKSNQVSLKLVEECRTEKYFKCYYGRKVLDRVRGSQHAELRKAIRQLKVAHEFHFSDQPNGSLVITHIATGNSFHPFGGDQPETMKGISDPTHIWCDEFDQFDDTDFRALYPTLRTIRGKNIFIGSFNSYEVLKSHWVVKYFFPEIYDGSEKMDYNALKGVTISKYLVNYTDNFFIDQKEYEAVLLVSAGGDADLFDGLAKGEWGLDKKGNEYYGSFKMGVHVMQVPYLPGKPVHLTYDFNLLPYMTLVCAQINETVDEFQIRFFKEYCLKAPQNTTEDVTAEFLSDHLSVRDVFYYGDAMGTRGVEGYGNNFTRFDPVREVLGKILGQGSDRTSKYNHGVLKRRSLVNKLLAGTQKYKGKTIRIMFDTGCTETKRDFQQVKIGIDGKLKEKKKDASGATYEELGHTSDAVEYLFASIFENLL